MAMRGGGCTILNSGQVSITYQCIHLIYLWIPEIEIFWKVYPKLSLWPWSKVSEEKGACCGKKFEVLHTYIYYPSRLSSKPINVHLRLDV